MSGRIDWVDIAKGVCIMLVVMMHSTLGVEAAAGQEGWMHGAVAFAKPFRMPDFFLVSGLFVGLRLRAPLWLFLDRKVLHFAYFYVLWLTIQFGFKAPEFVAGMGAAETLRLYLVSFVEPFGVLWFIYHLALFLVTVRLVRDVPRLLVLTAAAVLHVLPIHTGLVLIDAYAEYFVFFYVGVAYAPLVFSFAERVRSRPALGVAGLLAWGAVNLAAVHTEVAVLPGLSLVLGTVGALAIIAFAVLVADKMPGRAIAYVGARSIIVYLAFFLPMAVTRTLLLKLAPGLGIGAVSALVTIAGITTPLLLDLLIKRFGVGRFLFERPRWARLHGPIGGLSLAGVNGLGRS